MGRHKMHPDDVNARDWEFMLAERFPEVPKVSQTDGWVSKGLSWLSPAREDAVERARVALVNAWPNGLEGESLEPFVERLEQAFAPAKRPAVSTPPRGESTESRLEAQNAWDKKHSGPRNTETVVAFGGETYEIDAAGSYDPEPTEHHPYGTTPEGLIDQVRVEHESVYREKHGGRMPSCEQRFRDAEAVARKRWPQYFEDHQVRLDKLATLKARLSKACERFGALDIQVEGVVRDSKLGVRLLSASERWDILPGTVMTLTEAEMWLDHFEEPCHDESIASTTIGGS